MVSDKYKNLSIKKTLYEKLCQIVEDDPETYPSVSALVHETLEAFVWVKKHGVPEQWTKRRKP